ncbi:hypothetical protein GA0070606_0820 [Micromonospora citrea]|uniref:LPXTG-motif cell wall anchor domain-containing protein n=1 Tax=Micromonospora citrea TaxID=47855 RepID=A0A1C6TVM4_9ACTN|nr:hypothetical protein [Micromonospora citrea]SCL45651.1 hypothetical protein GA0070606_0820 [Micromonospora citrea]
MGLGLRWLSRAGAAALLVLAGLGVPAGPAPAAGAEPRFTFDLTGTTVPVGVEKKRIHLRLTNLTDRTPSQVIFHVRPGEPDWPHRISLMWPEGGGSGECDGDASGWYCRIEASVLPELLPAPGETVDLPIDVRVQGNQPFEGKFSVEAGMAWGDEPMETSDRRWFTLRLVDDPVADLSVVARDVKQSVRVGAGGRLVPTGTLQPGETGALRYRIVNQGRRSVGGVRVTLRVPETVTFTRPPEECAVADDRRSAVCTYDTLALVPAGQDIDPNDDSHSAVELHELVTVAASTRAPVTLTGGTVRVEGLAERTDARSGPPRTELPANAVAVPVADVDDSDNQDGFAVLVAASGSAGNGDGGDGDGGGGGGLPVTGPRTGLVAASGLALVAGGAVVLFLARRRRAVAVRDPGGTPAA